MICSPTSFNTSNILTYRLFRFLRFQRLLDCEMKKSSSEGVGLTGKKEEREAVTEEEEEKFWMSGELGMPHLEYIIKKCGNKLFFV